MMFRRRKPSIRKLQVAEPDDNHMNLRSSSAGLDGRRGAWKRRDILRSGAMALAAAGVGGCATNPVTGRRQLMLMSKDDEVRLDRAHSPHQFSADYGPIRDPALNAYIAEVGQALTPHTHRPQMPYSFRGVNASHVNAYAFPGGSIAVTRGLLAAMGNEAQLAALLGHELGHVSARHTAGRMTQAALAGLVVAGLAAAAAQKDERYGSWAMGLGGIGAGLLLARYSRDDERQADELGMQYARQAGYPPSGMIGLMDILRRLAGRQPNVVEQMFASHPMSEERYQTAVARSRRPEFAASGALSDQAERYLDATARVRAQRPAIEAIQQGDRALARGDAAAAAEHYRAALAAAPDDYEATLKLARCRLAAGQFAEAHRLAQAAFQAYPEEPQSLHVGGFASLRMRRWDAAVAEFEEYERRLPGNPNTIFLIGLAQEGRERRPEAVEHYRRFLAVGGGGDYGNHARQRLAAWGVATP